MRLNAFLAKAGVASRRKADEFIKAGRVTVNGETGQLNSDVSQDNDIRLDDRPVKLQQNRYILLYKPAGYVTTLDDPQGRPKVLDLINVTERVIPVGRLDFDTTGALLLTNNGQLAHKLMHPSFEIDKVYEAEVEGEITNDKLSKLAEGVELEEGKTAPSKAEKVTDKKVRLTIHEGRKHQVKRMLAAVNLPVKKLHRSKYGPLDLEGLTAGEWRNLKAGEILSLKEV